MTTTKRTTKTAARQIPEEFYCPNLNAKLDQYDNSRDTDRKAMARQLYLRGFSIEEIAKKLYYGSIPPRDVNLVSPDGERNHYGRAVDRFAGFKKTVAGWVNSSPDKSPSLSKTRKA